MTEHRIVSLIASATEIVAALGFENQLVGRSHECDFPPQIERLPACSEPKIDVNGTSREIDDRVKNVLREAVSVYRVHDDLLKQLQPTVVVTQTQCEVCAVSLKDVQASVCNWLDSRPQIVALEPMELADVWTDIRKVAESLDALSRAETLIENLRERLQTVRDVVQSFHAKRSSNTRPTIACIEWIDPLMSAGNWVPELVEVAGGINLFGEAGKHSPWMTWDDLREQDPDVIAIMPCGFDIARTFSELSPLVDHPQWEQLQAVQNGRVYVTDGNQYFNRPGPRLVESAEILAEILYPGDIDFGHHGTGWISFAEESRFQSA
ncbi:MAG: cobalamin-binding protein [Planctomycetaceae bacterium]